MIPRVLLLSALLAGSVGALGAAPERNWAVRADALVGAGDTRYLMEEPGSPYGVSSELVFPLSTLRTGATLRGEFPGRGRGWAFELSAAGNLLPPFGKMEDYDWWMYEGVPKVPFSYTESDARMRWVSVEASWEPVLARGGWGRLSALLGYLFQFMYQEILGYQGWYNDDDLDGVADGYYTQSGTGTALTYWVMYNAPTTGLALTLTPTAGWAVTIEGGLALPFTSDRDDHVLRNKLSEAFGLGIGAFAGLETRIRWGNPQARRHPYLLLSWRWLGMRANTRQTQAWYGDDPGTAGDDTGYLISGVDHQISTRQSAVLLAAGVEF